MLPLKVTVLFIQGFLLTVTASKSPSPVTIPGAYIVEFADNPHDNVLFFPILRVHILTKQHDAFSSDLFTSKIQTKPRTRLSSSIFNGTSFHLDAAHTTNPHNEHKTIQQIANLKSVKRVFPMRKYSLPYEVVSLANNTHAKFKFGSKDPKHGKLHHSKKGPLSTHVMAGVDKLHREGFTGAGIHIAMLDTGVDYTHPDLGGCFGPGCKIFQGYDLVGDDYNGTNEPVPDDDPFDNCMGHGTHVAGIIGSSGATQGYVTGVAPNARLSMYRILGCTGGVTNDVLIKGYLMAYESGADLITLSVGNAGGWADGTYGTFLHILGFLADRCIRPFGYCRVSHCRCRSTLHFCSRERWCCWALQHILTS